MTSTLRDDPQSRIFVGQSFAVGDVAEPLIPALERLLRQYPQMVALLEFTSPGGHRRQVDCALVSAGGIDLIEVKNKKGVVTGSADGEWRVRRGEYDDPVANVKAGRRENPYQQAYNTAEDLQRGLQDRRFLGRRIKVTPLVLLPSADPASAVSGHFNVRLALGVDEFEDALRASKYPSGGGWGGLDPLELPKHLGLRPMNLSFVCGRVTDAVQRRGVADVDVWADVAGQRHTTRTDEDGSYSLAVALGSDVELGFSPPELFLTPAVVRLRADQRYLSVDDLRLTNRYPRKTEDEIRGEVTREVEARVTQQVQARFQQQVDQSEAAWISAQASMGLVIDDLAGQLQAARLRLAEQEQQLQQNARRQEAENRLPLPVQVRQANELRVVQEQRGQVDEALQALQVADNAEQRDAVRQTLDLLTRLELGARRELTPAPSAALPVQVLGTTPRVPPPAPPTSEPDYVDVEVRQEKAPPQPSVRTDAGEQRAPSQPADVPPTPASPPPRRQVRWPLLAAGLVAAAVGGVAVWLVQPRTAIASNSPSTPTTSSLPVETSNEKPTENPASQAPAAKVERAMPQTPPPVAAPPPTPAPARPETCAVSTAAQPAPTPPPPARTATPAPAASTSPPGAPAVAPQPTTRALSAQGTPPAPPATPASPPQRTVAAVPTTTATTRTTAPSRTEAPQQPPVSPAGGQAKPIASPVAAPPVEPASPPTPAASPATVATPTVPAVPVAADPIPTADGSNLPGEVVEADASPPPPVPEGTGDETLPGVPVE